MTFEEVNQYLRPEEFCDNLNLKIITKYRGYCEPEDIEGYVRVIAYNIETKVHQIWVSFDNKYQRSFRYHNLYLVDWPEDVLEYINNLGFQWKNTTIEDCIVESINDAKIRHDEWKNKL